MRIEVADVGRARGGGDGGRRYRVIEMAFDTRATVLANEDENGWEPAIREQWSENRRNVVAGLLNEFGKGDAERKVEDFRALGPAPFSIVAEHNTLLSQVRGAFTFGAYYPALVGAAALGERLLNELVLTLRGDYDRHPGTSKRIRNRTNFSDWGHPIEVLHAWSVFGDATRDLFAQLETIRHESVHYTSVFASGARDEALTAIGLIQQIIGDVFGTLYREGVTIDDTPGIVMLRRDAEDIPLIRHFLLPRAVLVSPRHAPTIQLIEGTAYWVVHEDAEYPADEISDAEYAERLPGQSGEMAAALAPAAPPTHITLSDLSDLSGGQSS